MFDFNTGTAATKAELYAELLAAAESITAGEPDPIANMANIAALMWQMIPDVNWTGFYRLVGDELVLGPFCGKPACVRIAMGKGVCGVAASTGTSQVVPDVHSFPGHIACDAASASELVVPIRRGLQIVGVLDLDSPTPGRFDEEDRAGMEALARAICDRI